MREVKQYGGRGGEVTSVLQTAPGKGDHSPSIPPKYVNFRTFVKKNVAFTCFFLSNSPEGVQE